MARPGRSQRTPAKHELMNEVYAQQAAVFPLLQRSKGLSRVVWLDLTAADGLVEDGMIWDRNCSPGIQARAAREVRTAPVLILFCERQVSTYGRLLTSLSEHLPELGYLRVSEGRWSCGQVDLVAAHMDSIDLGLRGIRRGDAVFINSDPNAITSWPLRKGFTEEIIDRTGWLGMSLSTLGCNTGGLKRILRKTPEISAQWFAYVADLERAVPSHHDLLLAAIEGDDAQWAYLLEVPAGWRHKTELMVKRSFRKHGYAVEYVWLGQDLGGFRRLEERLFCLGGRKSDD